MCRSGLAFAALAGQTGLRYEGHGLSAENSRGAVMAIDPAGGHPAMDYPEHLRTYSGFLRATIVLIVLVAAILLFLLTLVP
jgi:Bacterial aa3 type cytochrome c oxidase subunit IV